MNNFFIDVKLVYTVVLVPGVRESDSVIHIYIYSFKFYSLIDYYKILSISSLCYTIGPC